MEQRTLLAITLSLLVLLVYNAIIPKPVNKNRASVNSTQVFANKQDTETNDKNNLLNTPKVSEIVTPLSPALPEEIKTIENEQVTIETSTIGGSIKSITLKKYSHKLPLTKILDLAGYENVNFLVSAEYKNGIEFSYKNSEIEIVKKYLASDGGSIVDCEISIKNISDMSKLKDIDISNFTITTDKLNGDTNAQNKTLFEYSISHDSGIFRKGNAFAFNSKESLQKPGVVKWTGFRDQYFCAIVKPDFKQSGYGVIPNGEKLLSVNTQIRGVELISGANVVYKFKTYFGLQNQDILMKYGQGFEEIVSFSNFGIVDFVSKLAIKTMVFIHKIIPSWGVAIILLCLAIYLIMYPLTMSGMSSMRKMQVLQPKMAQMREQYKNQPQKLNKEIMGLYKQNGVNPLGGCFPFILQMPVFIGLYQALWRTVLLKGEGFLWIKDLSYPDRLFVFSSPLPLIGTDFNILPIIMAIIMFFQQKLSTKNIVVSDPNQATQQKFMAIFFPIMLGFIFYHFSSGLTLYFSVFYLMSTFTQLKMSKMVSISK